MRIVFAVNINERRLEATAFPSWKTITYDYEMRVRMRVAYVHLRCSLVQTSNRIKPSVLSQSARYRSRTAILARIQRDTTRLSVWHRIIRARLSGGDKIQV